MNSCAVIAPARISLLFYCMCNSVLVCVNLYSPAADGGEARTETRLIRRDDSCSFCTDDGVDDGPGFPGPSALSLIRSV